MVGFCLVFILNLRTVITDLEQIRDYLGHFRCETILRLDNNIDLTVD